MGSWRANKRDGVGIHFFADGSTYEGEWKGGVRHGMGTFVDKAASVTYQGEWKDNKKHGEGILTMKDGSLFKGKWRNGEMIVRARQELPNLQEEEQTESPRKKNDLTKKNLLSLKKKEKPQFDHSVDSDALSNPGKKLKKQRNSSTVTPYLPPIKNLAVDNGRSSSNPKGKKRNVNKE